MFTFFTACFLAWMGKPEAIGGVHSPPACCRLAGGGTRRSTPEPLALSPKCSMDKLKFGLLATRAGVKGVLVSV